MGYPWYAVTSVSQVVQTEYTLGNGNPDVTAKRCIGGPLTHKLGQILPDVVDEMIVAFDDIMPRAEYGERFLSSTPTELTRDERLAERPCSRDHDQDNSACYKQGLRRSAVLYIGLGF